jgi:uncharacterized protein (TIGR02594 family)
MARFIVIADDAQLFAAPDLAAAHAPVPKGSVAEGDFVTPGGVWLKVSVAPAPRVPPMRDGFMREAALRPDADQPPEPVLDNVDFFSLVDNVARTRGVDRDYLIAVAWAETAGLAQLGNATSSKIGPFQFSQETWKRVIADPQASDLQLTPGDRRLWRPQVEMAAVLTSRLNDSLAAALNKPPTLGQLYFAHVFGGDVAAALLIGDQSRPFQSDTLAEEDKPLVVTEAGTPLSVADVLSELGRRLDTGYFDAAKVVDQQNDDIRFFHAEDGDPPWLMVAREEAFRGVFEFPGADNNARISEYLEVAGTGESADAVPWCGAFMAFCMKRCGDPAAARSVLSGSADAARWLDWGEEAPEGLHLSGTVVVLKPQVPNSSGHVGILIEDAAPGQGPPAGKIRLLGGNQGTPQRVCAVDFGEDQVRPHGYRRLPGTLPVPTSRRPVAPPPATTFGALVAGGFFSAEPMNLGVRRSIRTNNPGALDFTSWQAARPGFVGKTQPDPSPQGNVTTIYRTPEHGVASWFHLLSKVYGFGAAGSFGIRTLARKYAGNPANVDKLVNGWVTDSNDTLTPTSVIDINDDSAMLQLAKAMFRLEAGERTPVHDDQILFGIQRERSGTLPA